MAVFLLGMGFFSLLQLSNLENLFPTLFFSPCVKTFSKRIFHGFFLLLFRAYPPCSDDLIVDSTSL